MKRKLLPTTAAEELLLDMIWQNCDVTKKKTVYEIYHNHLSTNEDACAYFARRGIFKEKKRGVTYTYPIL
jgi:hypothetical protein